MRGQRCPDLTRAGSRAQDRCTRRSRACTRWMASACECAVRCPVPTVCAGVVLGQGVRDGCGGRGDATNGPRRRLRRVLRGVSRGFAVRARVWAHVGVSQYGAACMERAAHVRRRCRSGAPKPLSSFLAAHHNSTYQIRPHARNPTQKQKKTKAAFDELEPSTSARTQRSDLEASGRCRWSTSRSCLWTGTRTGIIALSLHAVSGADIGSAARSKNRFLGQLRKVQQTAPLTPHLRYYVQQQLCRDAVVDCDDDDAARG